MKNLELLVTFFSSYGYLAVFSTLIICGFGLPIPEDITLVAGGIITGLGYTDLTIMMIVSFLGVLLGDSIMFIMGYIYKKQILANRFISKIVTEERYQYISEQFSKRGKWFLFTARFMPGLRAGIFLTAGITRKVPFSLFITMDFIAALISVPVWVYLGYVGANNWDLIDKWIGRGQSGLLILVAIVLVIGLVWYFKNKFKNKRKV